MMIFASKVILIITAALGSSSAKTPHFLFVGQSNMEGVVENASCEPRFDDMIAILLSPNNANVFNQLVSHFETFDSRPFTPTTPVYEFMANELIRLKSEGVIHANFVQPLPTVDCSFYQLNAEIDYRTSTGEEPNALAIDNEVSPYANCGLIYGPELVFGHLMDDDPRYVNQLLSVVKFASGGSELDRHWSKVHGFFWLRLMEQLQNINTQQDEWTAIVWFQGENDSFDESNADPYLNDLTQFIADLRLEMHNVDTSTFNSPQDIPVVIVGLGCWVFDLEWGATVLQAQIDFVANDGNAALAPTSDLSCHFHFDEASQLLIGERVALALQGLLPVTPPTMEPSSAPSIAFSDSPTVSLSEQPSSNPSNEVSLSPSVTASDTPSIADSQQPSVTLSLSPSAADSAVPTVDESFKPSIAVSNQPSLSDSQSPSAMTSERPSSDESAAPSIILSLSPSSIGSSEPSVEGSAFPSVAMSDVPSVIEQTDPPSSAISSTPTAGGLWMYSEPEWWSTIIAMFQNDPTLPVLKTCEKRQFPPGQGEICGGKSKICFWGNQQCPAEGAYPTTECTCSAMSWSCQSLPCPGSISSSPNDTPSTSPPSVTPTVVESFIPSQVASSPPSLLGETVSPSNTPSMIPTNTAAPSTAPSIPQPAPLPTGPWSYTVPDWWSLVMSEFDEPDMPLKSCSKRQFPPSVEEMCGTKSKTCFWGNQECPAPIDASYPTTKCVCTGGGSGMWVCGDVACGSIQQAVNIK